jgi:hypothetical protein
MRNLLIVALLLSGAAAEANGEAVKSLRLVLPPRPDPAVENVGRVFARQVQSRCDARVLAQGEAPLTVELAIEPGLGTEGFRIIDSAPATLRISGNDDRGLLYGVGKFLHTSTYGKEGFTPGSWRGVSVPKMPVRGIYLATHFHNYYQVAPIEEVTRYVEDLSLWGVNSFLVWFGMEEFNGISDPKAQGMLERLRALLKIVKDLGLDASLGCICNDGYKNSPASLRADDSTVGHAGYHTRMGNRIFNLGNELCPSRPGVPEMELGFCQEKFEAFRSVGLDYWFITPYDNGGCTCAKCAPWGVNGYLRMAEPLARAYRRAFPKGRVVLGTWYFDRWADGEWAGITARFNAQKPDWVDYIMADNFEEYPRYPLDHGAPGGFPLLNFPDISMWGQDPWGGYGANPHPSRLQGRWNMTRDKLSGGFPYSEGIYEDLNKVICTRLYWDPDRPALETVKDYAAFEFSPAVVNEVTSVAAIFEENHRRDRIGERAVEASQLLDRAEAKLTPQAQRCWRWRLFRIRAAIDQELFRNSLGQGRDEVFQQACDELTEISHAENVAGMMRPQPVRAVKCDTRGPVLSADYPKAVAASKPVAWWRMNNFRARNIKDAAGHNNEAVCEAGVFLGEAGNAPAYADKELDSRAADLHGGRVRATLKGLADIYSVEFWFHNTLSHAARPVTAYLFSRGVEGPEGTPGDDLGISGTSASTIVPPGHLFFYNGDAAKQVVGKTELTPKTWNHIVLVRDGQRITVYLNGNATPEISGQMEKGYPDGVEQLFLGGRNDKFANLHGKIADVSVYDRALTHAEAVRHYQAAGQTALRSATNAPTRQEKRHNQ